MKPQEFIDKWLRWAKNKEELNKEILEINYKDKLRALLEGLETQNIDKLLNEGKTGDFRNYGKAYINSVRENFIKINPQKSN